MANIKVLKIKIGFMHGNEKVYTIDCSGGLAAPYITALCDAYNQKDSSTAIERTFLLCKDTRDVRIDFKYVLWYSTEIAFVDVEF